MSAFFNGGIYGRESTQSKALSVGESTRLRLNEQQRVLGELMQPIFFYYLSSDFLYNPPSYLEKHFKKSYNVYMNSLGILSAYSAYTGKANSAYGSASTSETKDIQRVSDAQNSQNNIASEDINDEAIISDEAKNLSAAEQKLSQNNLPNADKTKSKDSEETQEIKPKSGEELTPEQEQEIAKLKARDVEVRAHEQAHIAAAAGISTSAPRFDYQTGPDGQKYAIGGEVSISFSESGDPSKDIASAEAMRASALAPAEPSSQDMSVARAAEKMISEFKKELSEQKAEENKAEDKPDDKAVKTKPDDSSSPAGIFDEKKVGTESAPTQKVN